MDQPAIPAHAKLTAADGPGEHQVEKMAAARLQRFTDQEKTSQVHVVSRLLAELATGGLLERLPHLDATTGKQPVGAAVLAVLDEEDALAVDEADGHANADLAKSHARIIWPAAPTAGVDSERVFALSWQQHCEHMFGKPG
jgi:hypothetical protein